MAVAGDVNGAADLLRQCAEQLMGDTDAVPLPNWYAPHM